MNTTVIFILLWLAGAIINYCAILYVVEKKKCTFQDRLDYIITTIVVAGSFVIDIILCVAYVCSYIEWYLTDRRR